MSSWVVIRIDLANSWSGAFADPQLCLGRYQADPLEVLSLETEEHRDFLMEKMP